MKTRAPSLDACAALANDLRARGFVPLWTGQVRPGKDVQKIDLYFDFHAAPVLDLLERAHAHPYGQGKDIPKLLSQARTRWFNGTAHDVFWTPEWVACLAHGLRLVPTTADPLFAFVGLTRRSAELMCFFALRESTEAQAGLVQAFHENVELVRLARESAKMLGGPDAVQTIMMELPE